MAILFSLVFDNDEDDRAPSACRHIPATPRGAAVGEASWPGRGPGDDAPTDRRVDGWRRGADGQIIDYGGMGP